MHILNEGPDDELLRALLKAWEIDLEPNPTLNVSTSPSVTCCVPWSS